MAKQKTIVRPELTEDEEAALALTRERTRVVLRMASRSLLWVAVLVLAIYYLFETVRWVFYALTGVLLVVVLAVFFAYLIAPLVELVRKGVATRGRKGQPRLLPRTAAIAVVYVAIFGSLALGAWVLMPRLGTQMAEIAQQAPVYMTSARARANRLNKIYEDLNLPPSVRDSANKTVSAAIDDAGRYITGEGFSNAINVLGYLPYLVLIPILAFFFLKDADSFRRSALMMLPQGRIRWRGDELFQDINSTLAAYIRAQLISCLLIGSVCTLAFAILAGHELAGVTGIFLAIPVIAVLTVTYRHWLEHRGSSGLVAELLKPAETPAAGAAPAVGSTTTQPAEPPNSAAPSPAR